MVVLVAKWLGFIDNAHRHRPVRGPNSVEDTVSHLPGVQAVIQHEARMIGTHADLLLDQRSRVRTGASQVSVHQAKLDMYVALSDHTPGANPGERKAAAAGIEIEHRVLRDAVKYRLIPGG